MIILILLIILLILLVLVCLFYYNKSTYGVCKNTQHLCGKVVVITGATSGIGFEVAKDLACRGARLILGCLYENEGEEAKKNILEYTDNKDIIILKLDLASLDSVRQFAKEVLCREGHLEILINNAGIVLTDTIKTENGIHPTMQVNYFGPFLLTNLLLPLLKKSAPSRIVNTSSLAFKWGKIDLDNSNAGENRYGFVKKIKIYGDSKLCLTAMSVELARRLKGTGVTVNCLHPGLVVTAIADSSKLFTFFKKYTPLTIFFKNAWEGAQTVIYLSVSPQVANISGRYFKDCKEEKLPAKIKDADLCKQLWEVSEELVSVNC